MSTFILKDLRSNSLEELPNDEEEERQLAELPNGKEGFFATGFFEIAMKLSCIDLEVRSTTTSSGGFLHCNMRPKIPKLMTRIRMGKFLWEIATSKPLVIGRVFIVSFSSILLAIGFYLSYKHDRLIRDLELSIPDFDKRQSECVRLETFEPSQVRKVRELENIKRLIRTYGIILTNLPGQGVINLGTVGLLSIPFFYLTQLLLRKQLISCDLVCFFFWPLAERRRVLSGVRLIIYELVISIKNKRFLRFIPKSQRDQVESSSFRRKKEDLQFLQLLRDIDTFRLVKPISVSTRWYMKLASSFNWMLKFSVFAAAILPAISSVSLITLDIMARTSLRHEQIKCTNWHQDSFLLKIPHDFREFSKEEQEAYANYDGSLSSYMHLFLHIEASHYFSLSTCTFLTCYLALLVSIFFWGTFFVNTFIFASMDKVVWINQLDHDIKECLKLSKLRGQDSIECSDQEYQQLMKVLTVSYLNFELFRRQYIRYIPLAKFFLSQGSMLGFVSLLLFYFVGTSIETKGLTSVLYTCAALAGVINIYLMGATVVSIKMEKIMKNLANLLGHLRNSRMIYAYPVELWRRQALTEGETRNFYALHLFGHSLSYKDLISFNLHVIMLGLILMKINNKYTLPSNSTYA